MLVPTEGNINATAPAAEAPVEAILDFSGDIGSATVPEFLAQALVSPDYLTEDAESLTKDVCAAVAERFHVMPEQVAMGQGETEFIYAIPRAMRPRRTVILAPCRQDFWRANDLIQAESEGVLAAESHEFIPEIDQFAARLSGVDMAFVGNPNNPTGVALPAETLRTIATRFPSTTFVVDETYVEFVPDSMNITLLGAELPGNVIVLRSASPLLGLPGLRLGFMISDPELCGMVARAREPRLLDGMTIRAAKAIFSAPLDITAMRDAIIAEREKVREELSRLTGLRVFRSAAGFLLLKITRPGLDFPEVQTRLQSRGVMVRNAASYRGLDGKFLRICIRKPDENNRLIKAFQDAFDQAQWK